MPTYEVDVGGKTYEVDAPDPNTAWQWANYTHKNPPKEPGFFSNVGELLVKGGKQTLAAAEVAPSVISGGDVAAKSRLIAEQLATPRETEPRELKEIKGAFKEEGKAWEAAQGFGESSKVIGQMLFEVGRQAITNPKGLLYMTAEQAANMAPSIAGMLAGGKGGAMVGAAIPLPGATAVGAGIGAIGGAFTGQAPVEIGSEFIGLIGKELQNRGLEPTERNVQALMQDKAFLQQAISDARTKGATTAAIDAATTLGAGKFASGPKNAAIKAARTELGAGADLAQVAARANEIMASRTLTQKVGRGLGAAGIDVAGGGISEAGGQLAAYGKVDLEDVALEMLGELGGAAVEVPFAARALRTPGLPGAITPPTPTPTPSAGISPPPEPPIAPAAPPVEPKATAPESEAQDTSAMLREILAQTEEKPATPAPVSAGKPVEPKVTPAPVTPTEVNTFGAEVKQVTPPAQPPVAAIEPGAEAGNGFKQGPAAGERYRISTIDSAGGALAIEKRYPAGTAATFYVGKDGNLVDGDNVNFVKGDQNKLWVPADENQRQEASSILDEMGKLALNDPARKAAKERLKALVTAQPTKAPAAPVAKPPAAPTPAAAEPAVTPAPEQPTTPPTAPAVTPTAAPTNTLDQLLGGAFADSEIGITRASTVRDAINAIAKIPGARLNKNELSYPQKIAGASNALILKTPEQQEYAKTLLEQQRKPAAAEDWWNELPEIKSENIIAPAGEYKPGQKVELNGRTWIVTAVSHTGNQITVKSADGAFEERRIEVAKAAPTPPAAVTPTPIQVYMGLEDASTESLKDGPVKDVLLASGMINGRGILTPSGRDLLTKLKPPGLSARQPSSEEAEAMIQESVLQPAAKAPAAPVEVPKPTAPTPVVTLEGWKQGTNFQNQKTWTKDINGQAVQVLQTGPKSFAASNADAIDSPSNTFRTLQDAQRAATVNATKPAPAVTPAAEAKPVDEKAKAKQDLEDALADLVMLATKSGRMNIVPEDEQELMPILTRLMDAAFRLGHIKFKEAARFVMDTIRSHVGLGDKFADQVTLDHLQGAYIGMAGKYQDQGASSKKEVVGVESIDELQEAEKAGEIDPQAIADHFLAGNEFGNINAARQFLTNTFGVDTTPGTESAKKADEAIEAGIVIAARQIIKDGKNPADIFDQLVDLYERQPNLSVRSSTSVANQAYSTPAPLAYVASELAGITNKTTVLEPTAGNGMLLIAANPDKVTANELDKGRFDALKSIMPGADITQGNALDMDIENNAFDVVIANPPFGKVGEISNIDHDIVLKSLVGMKEDGRAVLIVGGVQATTEEGRREGYRSNAKRNFYYELYNLYNVVDHFTAGGNMYAKQGTTYPVDVIVIDGVGKSSRDLPAADLPELITTYEQLKEKLNEAGMVSGESKRPSGTDVGAGAEGEAGRKGVATGAGRPGGGSGTEGGRPAGGIKPGVSEAGPAVGGQPGTTGRGTSAAQPGAEDVSKPVGGRGSVAGTGEQAAGERKRRTEGSGSGGLGGVSIVSGERVGSGLTDRVGQEQETAGQVTYNPRSQANSVGTLVPRAMADSIERSLERVEAAEGGLDNYVATSLEMDPETVKELFSAEQIDALALAIRNAQEGKGFIIGDQTGIGKGRVVAGMIRYALINDKIPIFVTEKPNLYSDMIRDLDDIGMTNELALDTAKPKILITNSKTNIPYTLLREVDGKITENNLMLKPAKTGAALDGVLKKMQEDDSLGDYKVIFTTYSQLQTYKGKQTERMRFVTHFGAGNYMIFDESHNAGGAGEQQARTKEQREKAKEGESLVTGRAAFVRNLVRNAFGTFFSSATYAKRPDVMDLYSSTDMSLAVEKISDLAEAIKSGGIPMQQTVAKMLTQVGQYIRRERTFAGVSYDTQETKVDKATAENMATSMRDILAFSRAKEAVVKGIQKELDKQGAKTSEMSEKSRVQSANFGAIMHNLIDQMLLALKAQDSVRHAVERLKAGEKVVMTVSNTMGSFLKDYADEMGLSAGDKVNLSFADLYTRYLEKQRIIKIKHPGGRIEEYRLTDQDLGPAMVEEYNRIKEFIENAGFGSAPISPIDYMHAELRKVKIVGHDGRQRNVKTEEITGRNMVVNYQDGTPVLASRSSSIRQRVNAVKAFNSGAADVIILNQAGSTGLSLHASNKVEDKRKRHMIIVQPEKNIDTHMQMLGRVHRTGQVITPAYSQMMADIPAEMRPAAVLLKKMASLNANTTASRKSAVTAEGAVDFMNDYGGQVVNEYLRDNPEVYQAIGGKSVVELSEDPTEANEDDIRKFTGYVPILPIKQQEEIYKDLIDRYNDLIQREDSMGTNKLEAKAFDLDARTIGSEQITEDKGDPSVFAQPAFMEKVDVKRTVKPLSKEEVQDQVKENLKGMTVNEFRNLAVGGAKDRAAIYGRDKKAEMEAAAKPDPVAIDKFRNDLQTQYNHIKTVIDTYPIGTPVSIKNTNGVFVYGVVTNIESKGKTKNPVAGSDWKMTLALANGDAKSITLNFSQIGATYTLAREDEVQWLNPDTLGAESIPLTDLFDKGATVRREKRWMVTGNILAGFAAVGNIGQIMTYTKDDGTTAQGILMPRTFDFEKAQKNAAVRMNNLEAVMTFFNEFGRGAEVMTPEGNLKITYMGGTEYRFVSPSSKREGGSFYLDRGLTDITGDFYKSGQIMRTVVYDQEKANRAIQYLLADREETLVASNHKDEAREMFMPKIPLANVQPDMERQSLDTNGNFVADRETLIRKYQGMRQKRGSIMRKFKKGEAGLNEQEAINTIDEIASQLKDDIVAGKTKRTDAKNFFARATKEWNDGNISDDVYAAIKTMYEQYPFVLEGLNLSVKQQPADSNATGQFFSLARLVRLYKGTNGVQDPVTIRHEVTHGLEQMMTAEAAADLIMDWSDKLGKAIKREKSPKARVYFQAILDFYENPSIDAYNNALSLMPSYDYYQYINPSEYWAVNAEKLMQRKLGSGWDKFVLAVRRLFEGLKYMFGFDNQYIVNRIFNDVMSSKGERFTKAALNDYVDASVMGMLNLDENTRRNYRGKPAPLASWDSPEKSKMDDWAYRWQDKHIDTKRVVQSVIKGIGDIADRFDAYLKETLYHGRVAKQTMDFLKRDFRPFIEKMAKMGVKVDEFEFYLQNRHAQEYNELIASRNPGMPDAGSGISNEDAIKYLNSLSAEEKAKYEELAKDVDKFVEETQDMLVANGLETQERINSWREMFKHYVPLKRDPNELDFVNPSFGMGKGFAIRGDFSRTATGSLKTVVDILNNIALQREMAIVRSEKARVGRALYGMALQAPNPEFWMPINPDAVKNKKKLIAELQAMGLDPADAENILQEPRTPRIDKKTGMVEYAVNPAMRNMPNVFPVRINGKDRFIIFNPADPRAKRMVEALKNMDAHQLENGLDTIAELTRLIAAMNTQFNPVFGAWNFVRDVESAAVNLTGTPIADKRMEVVAGAIPALKAIYRDLRGKTPKDAEAKEWIDLYERFANAGGQTGYREQFTRAKDKATLVQREMARLNRSNVRKVANAVADWLSDYNDAMENAVRLSAFKAALESGMSEDRAAELAKNLTVNFNRKGAWTTNANAFYAFLNASVQGTARMAQLIVKRDDNGKYSLTRGGKLVIAGGMMLGAMQAALLAFAGFDADEPPEFLKNKNLIIPNPFGQGYAIIPMPLGLNVFPNVARLVTEYALTQAGAMTGKRDLPKTILSIGSAVLDAFNPLGSSGLVQTLSPTLVDPFAAIAENKDAFGRPISKENRTTNPSPGWERSRDGASAISQGLAYGINYLTGGGKYGIGAWSPTADDIDYVFSQYMGGLGREAVKAGRFAAAKVEGEETPPYKVPILGKAYGETETPSAVTDKFYKNVTMLAELEGEMKRMREKRENLTEFMKDNPEYRFIQNANNLENQISKINKTIKEIQKRPETEATKAQIERYKEQKQRMMNNFNERVKALQRQ